MTPSMLPGMLLTLATMLFGVPYLFGQQPANQPARLTEKTLVVWVSPENLIQRGGSVLTIDDNEFHFDGIVFGELEPTRWMAGSDLFRRTQRDQTKFPEESIFGGTMVQIAIVYSDNTITTFRNGDIYSRHDIDGPQNFPDGSVVVIGPRHIGSQDFYAGQIDDARIYNTALTETQLKALKPGVVGDLRPWAWWNFDDGDATEKTERFAHTKLTSGAVVKDGRLILDGKTGALFASTDRGVVELLASQKQRLGNVRIQPPEELILNYHLMHPGDDSLPGDPNAAFFVDGIYHLHYIIQHPWNGGRSFSFAHVTSTDMLHWTWQTTKLQPAFTGHGMFSGTGFLTKEATNWLLDQRASFDQDKTGLDRTQLGTLTKSPDSPFSPRIVTILTYALAGFSNFGAIGIQVGSIGGLEPSRRDDLARLGLRAMFGGAIACCMTGAVAGIIL